MREPPSAGPFTTRAATSSGWTSSALKNAVRQGRLIRPRRGVYVLAPASGPVVDAIAAACNYPDAVVSHRSATLLHGLPLLGTQPPIAELTVRPGSNANLAGVRVHRAGLRAEDVVRVGGGLVTSVARSVVDLARHRSLAVSVAAIDAALYRRLTTLAAIDDVLRSCWNWPRIVRARRAVALSDGRAESPLESVSRLVIGWLGLPVPEPQKVIRGVDGYQVGRVDFYWDEFGVAGEADGRSKYDDREVLTAEKDRQELLEGLGLVVARWGWRQAVHNRSALGAKIESAFARGLLRDRSGFPRGWTL